MMLMEYSIELMLSSSNFLEFRVPSSVGVRMHVIV